MSAVVNFKDAKKEIDLVKVKELKETLQTTYKNLHISLDSEHKNYVKLTSLRIQIQAKILTYWIDAVKLNEIEDKVIRKWEIQKKEKQLLLAHESGKINIFQIYKDSQKIQNKINPLDIVLKDIFNKLSESFMPLKHKCNYEKKAIATYLSGLIQDMLKHSHFLKQEKLDETVEHFIKNIEPSYCLNAYLNAIHYFTTEFTERIAITLPIFLAKVKEKHNDRIDISRALSDLKIFYLD
jgi:tetrahydromethanopterin S-methyltransferase subunit B